MLRGLWRFWTESWSAPRRARWLYIAMTAAFGGLAIAGAVMGEAAVAAIAGIVAVATASLAVLAPRLAEWTKRDVGTEL